MATVCLACNTCFGPNPYAQGRTSSGWLTLHFEHADVLVVREALGCQSNVEPALILLFLAELPGFVSKSCFFIGWPGGWNLADICTRR